MSILTNAYFLGTLVRLSATFTDSVGAPVDPTTVTVKVLAPDGTTATYVFGISDVVRDALGVFRMDVLTEQAGSYCYRWEGTGAAQVAQEHAFTVDAGCFAS